MDSTEVQEGEGGESHRIPSLPAPSPPPALNDDVAAFPPAGPAPDPQRGDPVDARKLPEVPDNKKGWLKGPALEFLERKHLPHYLELYEESPAQAKEYADTACNDLHMHFDFRLPMNVAPDQPYDPKEVLSSEDGLLRTAIIARDRISVLNWLRKEATKARGPKKARTVTAKSGGDAMDVLLGRVNGIEPGSLKGTAPYQLWAKEEGEEDRTLFRKAFKDSGEPTRLRADREAAHMSSVFANLPKEVQESYRSRVAEEKVKAQEDRDRLRELMDRPLPPLEAQNVIDRFGTLMSPFLEQVAKLSGMKILMVMGGAEPRRGGKLNMLVQNYGKDKSAVPVRFCGNPARYQRCLDAFGEFLVECYDKEDELARALPGAEDSMDTEETAGSSKVPYEEVDILKGLLQLEDEQFSDEEDLAAVPAPKKRGRAPKGTGEKGVTVQQGKRKRADDEVAPSKKKKGKTAGGGQADFTETSARSRGKKKKVVASIGQSLSKLAGPSVRHPSPPPPPQPSASPGNPEPAFSPLRSPAPLLPESPRSGPRRPLRNGGRSAEPSPFNSPIRASPRAKKTPVQTPVRESTRLRRQAPTPSSAAIDPRLLGTGSLRPFLASPLATRSSQRGAESNPPSPLKSISFGGIPIFGPNDMPNPFEGTSVMLPVQRQKPTLSPEDAAYLEEGIWPAWFVKARETLKSPLLSSLGDSWDDMMWFWTIVEGRQNFQTSRSSIGPQSLADLRPVEVHNWQKRKRGVDYMPELNRKDLKSLGDAWWSWWKQLQPEWRGVSDVEGCLEAAHQVGSGEWGYLWHPGANGLVTVLVCLKWWGELMTKHYGMGSIRMRRWEAAVEDVLWVMSSMVT